ncbi:hypothetical protein NC653_017936 [Populus alba x Populus x berolinensis]|uniref:Uncharacterized protein n=1 Tax=Populus alba x Populus x berolinensis TaxID=444605 RepID=A0AAD6QRG9_9ROSI|nr:hypothetical protein NC653_017936 [Populus alba x Populus x berolinensis]
MIQEMKKHKVGNGKPQGNQICREILWLNWFKTNVPAKSSKQCQATYTIVQVTSLRLLGEVVSCHKAKFTALGLNYLTS